MIQFLKRYCTFGSAFVKLLRSKEERKQQNDHFKMNP